jgi:hypothetical protein
MKPVGLFGTGVAQTVALIVCCIEDAIRWITICRLQARECDSGRGEARRNQEKLGSYCRFWTGGGRVYVRLMYEERLKPEATGTEPFFLGEYA